MTRWLLLLLGILAANDLRADEKLMAGFAETDITPDLQSDKPVWIAGYGHGRSSFTAFRSTLTRFAGLGEPDRASPLRPLPARRP